ncbi:type II toxin-antitoxin system RelE/ParE family toxin [Bacteroides sp. GD17]|jgi:plasmid stabilization system protein ParE|uniref:type II toxin-antitoxin system RelE/ParE family toxin n=1 Tax=Bacteroides sp. GD17 TaxID=3139826 RepID=UPI0025E3FBF2|nr:type II toxin-antitoxin system RelE/ParE family toxin [uncultured Bacteroides sp.]
MRVEWSPCALREWENTVRYIFREFGRKAAEEFEQDIAKWESRITINPELAHQELLLKDRIKLYRGLIVSKHSKLIFYVEDEVVYIADLWDMRREPSRLSRRLK